MIAFGEGIRDGLKMVAEENPQSQFTYDAIDTGATRRRQVRSAIYSEDRELTPQKRKSLLATNHDLRRNFTVAGWAVRKHLDYVSEFTFQSKTGDTSLDKDIEDFIAWASRKENFDVRGRHSRQSMMRLLESHRTFDGDVGLAKISGGKVQGIESDLIRDPEDAADKNEKASISHGIKRDENGKATKYYVHRRNDRGGYEFVKEFKAKNFYHHFYSDRLDQGRGVSPMAPAINHFRDIGEGITHTAAKIKVAALFGMAIFRDAAQGAFAPITETNDEEGREAYQVDFSKGPFLLDLDPGDRAEFLKNETAANETIDFFNFLLQLGLKCLDIPFSFYNEAFSVYSGSRQALLQYAQSARSKQRGNIDLQDDWTKWRLRLAILDGDLTIPASVNLEKHPWIYRPSGLPWIDPLKERTANAVAVRTGQDSLENIVALGGGDVYDVIDSNAKVIEYAKKRDVPIEFLLTDLAALMGSASE